MPILVIEDFTPPENEKSRNPFAIKQREIDIKEILSNVQVNQVAQVQLEEGCTMPRWLSSFAHWPKKFEEATGEKRKYSHKKVGDSITLIKVRRIA